MVEQKIGFIGGGQMAQALAAGGVKSGIFKTSELVFSEPSESQRNLLNSRFAGAIVTADTKHLLDLCDRIVLAVKPQVLKSLAGDLSKALTTKHLIVSIAAGITLSQLQEMLKTGRVIRVMPNTPAQIGSGAAGYSVATEVDEADCSWVETLMGAVGTVEKVSDGLMHAVTAVSGSGPAYIYLVIEAMSDGGVAMGLPRDLATKLAAQTVLGAAKMVLEEGKHPSVLKDQVTSPGGTTITALRELEAAGVRSAFIEAIARATDRSIELSQ